jgi:hypothetical protein
MSLEENKDKLSECYKINKPVLLYGDNSAGHIDLIHGIHIDNGGIRDAVEYVRVKEEPDRKVFLESIKNESSNALIETYAEVKEIFPRHDGIIDDDVYNSQFGMMVQAKHYSIKEKLYCKVREAFKSTKKTWVYCNCDRSDEDSLCNNLSAIGDWRNFDEIDDPLKEGPLITSGRYLYDFKGTLFIDNLKCDSSNIRDVEHYWKFGMEISNKNISVHWLVAYVSSLDGFPKNFLKQFEPIPLDNSSNEVKRQKKKAIVSPVEKLYKPEANIEGKEIEECQASKLEVKLKIVQGKKEVYWEGNQLSNIKKINFSIILKLAKTPGKSVMNDTLHVSIDSKHNKDVLLNQRIYTIRNSFPSPYSDIKHPQCIIPDAKKNKGCRYLNLTKEQVEIV